MTEETVVETSVKKEKPTYTINSVEEFVAAIDSIVRPQEPWVEPVQGLQPPLPVEYIHDATRLPTEKVALILTELLKPYTPYFHTNSDVLEAIELLQEAQKASVCFCQWDSLPRNLSE